MTVNVIAYEPSKVLLHFVSMPWCCKTCCFERRRIIHLGQKDKMASLQNFQSWGCSSKYMNSDFAAVVTLIVAVIAKNLNLMVMIALQQLRVSVNTEKGLIKLLEMMVEPIEQS